MMRWRWWRVSARRALIIAVVLGAAGAGLVAGGLAMTNSRHVAERATTALVLSVGGCDRYDDCSYVVSYAAQGLPRMARLWGSDEPGAGSVTTVYYQVANPGTARFPDSEYPNDPNDDGDTMISLGVISFLCALVMLVVGVTKLAIVLARVRFPSRVAAADGVPIQPVPGLGTTWYGRGASYWLRRAGFTAGCAALLALWTVIVGAFIHGSGPAGSPAFIAVLTAEIALSLVTGVWQFRRIWTYPAQSPNPDRRSASVAGRAGAGLGALAGGGSVVAGFVLALIALLTYGMMLAVFASSLAPALPVERAARRRLAGELRRHQHHGHGVASQQPGHHQRNR